MNKNPKGSKDDFMRKIQGLFGDISVIKNNKKIIKKEQQAKEENMYLEKNDMRKDDNSNKEIVVAGVNIKKHNFEEAKNRIMKFSKKEVSSVEIRKVRTEGSWFSWNDHNVTGEEFNERIADIQKFLVEIYETNNKTIKEFGEVYKALDSLDKDYIAGILSAIKANEKTSDGLVEANKRIEKVVGDQKKIVCTLLQFKERLDSNQHLFDIDTMWNRSKEIEGDVNSLSEKVDGCESSIDKISEQCRIILKVLQDFQEHINALKEYQDELSSINHLKDVDGMWKQVQEYNAALEQLSAQCRDVAALANSYQSAIEDSKATIAAMDKKLQNAYMLAGGAAVLAVATLAVLFVKVL